MTKLSRREVTLGLASIGLLGVVAPARAHHGWGSYDSAQVLNLEGRVVESRFVNPHGELRLQVAGKVWLCTLAPPSRMQNRGLTAEMIAPGTTCTVVGYPNKSDPSEMRAERIIVAGKTVELR
jgi:hypothetical protein